MYRDLPHKSVNFPEALVFSVRVYMADGQFDYGKWLINS